MYSIIKEYVKSKDKNSKNKHFIIRTDCCGSTLGFLQMLRREIQKDFPEIKPKQIDVILYGGRSYKGTFGLEWNSTKTPPKEYKEIPTVEFKL